MSFMARVLVWDDERHIFHLTQVNLERQRHDVETCANADDCLAKLRAGAFDLLEVDSDMPDLVRQVETEFEDSIRITVLGTH